jgi:hypothetical protein
MATVTTVPLEGLADRIALQQAELESLRKEYEARQARLARLQLKKDVLAQKLVQIDAAIQAVSAGTAPRRGRRKVKRGRRAAAPASAGVAPPMKMADVLAEMVREAGGPCTAKTLADELQRRGLYADSPNLPRIVQARLYELVQAKVLKKARGERGVVARRRRGALKARGRKKRRLGRTASKESLRRGPDGQPQRPLRAIVTDLLAKSSRPLPATELAKLALAQGYSTKSKDLKNVLWVLLGKMDNVENVSGQGYRLK